MSVRRTVSYRAQNKKPFSAKSDTLPGHIKQATKIKQAFLKSYNFWLFMFVWWEYKNASNIPQSTTYLPLLKQPHTTTRVRTKKCFNPSFLKIGSKNETKTDTPRIHQVPNYNTPKYNKGKPCRFLTTIHIDVETGASFYFVDHVTEHQLPKIRLFICEWPRHLAVD